MFSPTFNRCHVILKIVILLALQLQEVFSNYKKERGESEKTLAAQNEKFQEQLSDLRSQNAKITTQLEFASKRCEQSNAI